MTKGPSRASPGRSAPPTAEASGAVGHVNRWLPDTRRRVEAALRGTASLKVSELLAGELRYLLVGVSELVVVKWALEHMRIDVYTKVVELFHDHRYCKCRAKLHGTRAMPGNSEDVFRMRVRESAGAARVRTGPHDEMLRR